MRMISSFHKSWEPLINLLYQKPLSSLFENVLSEISFQPRYTEIFKVFEMPVEDIKVVIMGLEPSIIPGNSMGYAYAIPEEGKMSNELFVIHSEIQNELTESWKTLSTWRKQGVFLLNASLTVETGNVGSHEIFWKSFTETVIRFIATKNPCIWLFWGPSLRELSTNVGPTDKRVLVNKYNKETIENIPATNDLNYILTGPKPLNDHFYLTNVILQKKKSTTIAW